MDNSAHSAAAVVNSDAHLQKPKSRLLTFRDRLLSPHLKEYRPHAAESLHQRQVTHVAHFVSHSSVKYRSHRQRCVELRRHVRSRAQCNATHLV